MPVRLEAIDSLSKHSKLTTKGLDESGATSFKPMYLKELNKDWKEFVQTLRELFERGYSYDLVTIALSYVGMNVSANVTLKELVDGAYIFNRLSQVNNDSNLIKQYETILDELLGQGFDALIVMEVLDNLQLYWETSVKVNVLLGNKIRASSNS